MNQTSLFSAGCAFVLALSGVACSPSSSSSSNNTGGAGGSGSNADCTADMNDLIADFMTDNGLNPADGRSGGFYVYGDDQGAFDPPKNGDNPYPIDMANGNPTCSGPGSFHVKASGFKVWGAAAGADFVPKSGSYKGTYDASKYKGVTFWAKGAAAIKHVQVSFPDVYTDGAANPTPLDATTSPCVYTAGANNNCSPYLVKFGEATDFPGYAAASIDATWRPFYVLFADTKQDKNNAGFHRAVDKVDVQHLTGMAIQVNADYSSGTAAANDFELWIDDVHFIK
jgi:hypothetical protein